MFLDSDNNTDFISSFADDNFSNHMGLFTSSSHRENHRYNDVKDKIQSAGDLYDIPDMDCTQLDAAKSFIDEKEKSALAMSTGSRGARRVRDRYIKVVNHFKPKINDAINSRDCEGDTSAIDVAQQETKDIQEEIDNLTTQVAQREQEVIAQANAAIMDAQTDADKQKKMYMVIGGSVIAILLLALVMKK